MTRFSLSMVLWLAACQPAPVGVRDVEVPKDATPQCASLCTQIGLPLDSVVIMANNVGCVCRAGTPAPPASTAPPGAPASAGGMAAIMIADEAARQAAARNAAASKPK